MPLKRLSLTRTGRKVSNGHCIGIGSNRRYTQNGIYFTAKCPIDTSLIAFGTALCKRDKRTRPGLCGKYRKNKLWKMWKSLYRYRLTDSPILAIVWFRCLLFHSTDVRREVKLLLSCSPMPSHWGRKLLLFGVLSYGKVYTNERSDG